MSVHKYSSPIRIDSEGEVFSCALGECSLYPTSANFLNNSGSSVDFILSTSAGGGYVMASGTAHTPLSGSTPQTTVSSDLAGKFNGCYFHSSPAAPTTGTADGGNTGNGTCTGVAITGGWIPQTITLTCTDDAVSGSEVFSVVSSKPGPTFANATVGVAYSDEGLAFTLNDGVTDFVVGDIFTIAITAGFSAEIYQTRGRTIFFAPTGLTVGADSAWAIESRVIMSRTVAANTNVSVPLDGSSEWTSLRAEGTASDAIVEIHVLSMSKYKSQNCGGNSGSGMVNYGPA